MKRLTLCIIAMVLTAALCASVEVRLKLATTTSTDNSGLLNVLLPPLRKCST